MKRQTPDRFTGYSGNTVNIKTKNGIVAETEVNADKMICTKEEPHIAKSIPWSQRREKINLHGELGHKLYEQWRVLDPDSIEIKTMAAKMRDYYSRFQ